MDGSILNTVKKVLGLDESYEAFDIDIVMHINSVFDTLHQLGVGPSMPFHIEDATAKWGDFISPDGFYSVKTYMTLRVRLLFDPPATSFAIEAYQKQITELEWRFSAMTSSVLTPPSTGEITAGGMWDLTGLSDFPEEAKIGDLGIDFNTSDIWRKV